MVHALTMLLVVCIFKCVPLCCGAKSLAVRVDEEVCVLSIFLKLNVLIVVLN